MLGSFFVEFEAKGEEQGKGEESDGEKSVVGLFESYVCKDGKREVADREEKGGRRGGEKEGEEGIGDKVEEKDGGAFLKGESEKKGKMKMWSVAQVLRVGLEVEVSEKRKETGMK